MNGKKGVTRYRGEENRTIGEIRRSLRSPPLTDAEATIRHAKGKDRF
jgi:hypothetical protein